MTELQRRIRAFRIRLILRLAGYAALVGLVVALVLVIAAPWLRDQLGLPGYWLTLALPLIFPAVYVAYALLNRPGERTTVLAADAWCGGEGSIVSAWELEREHPDSPFVKPVAAKAVRRLEGHALPEPRLLRKLLVAMLVLLALVPLSRYVHAQLQDSDKQKQADEQAKKVDTPPKDAEKMAKEAATAAELAKKLGAKPQQRLADDLEQAARNAQAGGQDKERALRDANNLVDRAHAQTEAQQRRADTRQALKNEEATRELGKALDQADVNKTQREIDKLTDKVYRPDGSMDPEAAEQLRQAVKKAARQAPQDPRIRRAAEHIENMLNQQARDNVANDKQRLRERMKSEGKSEKDIQEALKKLQQTDKRALQRALEDLSKSSSPLRDMNLSDQQLEKAMNQLKDMKLSPEQAKQMAEAARQLSERLRIDGDTLREMLKKGREYEGLDKAAKKLGGQGKQPGGPKGVPEWAKQAVPKEWKEAWEQASKNGGQPGEDGRPGEGRNGNTSGTGGDNENGPGTHNGHGKHDGGGNPNLNGGKEGGVKTGDTGQGSKDPDKDPHKLDPTKAGSEHAWRKETGNSSDSGGINTRDEEERLPRRYREAARKYFKH